MLVLLSVYCPTWAQKFWAELSWAQLRKSAGPLSRTFWAHWALKSIYYIRITGIILFTFILTLIHYDLYSYQSQGSIGINRMALVIQQAISSTERLKIDDFRRTYWKVRLSGSILKLSWAWAQSSAQSSVLKLKSGSAQLDTRLATDLFVLVIDTKPKSNHHNLR